MAPGILYVTMQPKPSLPSTQFEDWYNNEHGPLRLRLPCIENGFRYRATDLEEGGKGLPEWMAVYNMTDCAELLEDTYLKLRRNDVRSCREIDTMAQIKVDRRVFDFVDSKEVNGFKRLEDVDAETTGNVIVAVSQNIFPGKKEELDNWSGGERIPLLSKVPGWLRSRRYVSSSIEEKPEIEYLTLHEFAPENGLGGDEMKVAMNTPRTKEVMTSVVREERVRTYDLYYTFGPAPRHLRDISHFTSNDETTKTYPTSAGKGGAIESFITTPDGVDISYRLEGSPDLNAPLIVLSNSILVDWGIWDSFITSFFSSPQNSKYRVLRYLTRGRSCACGTQTITVDLLALDIIALLDALRVQKAAAIVGVSLGGATVLNAGLKYPDRIAGFISCDTSSKSPAGNRELWGERIVVAENEGAESSTQTGEKIVGEQLAEATVRRWFVKESYDGGKMEEEITRVKAMVASNSIEGFKKSVNALFEYDLKSEMRGCSTKGAFVVGGGDGKLPGVMKDMAAALGESGVKYVVVDGAGHLPMVEQPDLVAACLTNFLAEA